MTADIDEFETAAGAFLHADPVRNTVLLTVVATLRTSGATTYSDSPPLFGWYGDSTAQAVFLRTPPMPPIVSDAPVAALQELVGVLDGVSGVRGPAEGLKVFAEAWHAATGRLAEVVSNRRLFRLAELTPPEPAPPGSARLVTEADRELLVEWFTAFGEDVGEAAGGDVARSVDRRLANGELLLWEVDGVPASLAGTTAPIAGVTRVAPVFTPRTLRGRGYAGVVTTAISRRGLDAGLEVVLFTDMTNPTSNALYQRLGYRPIGHWTTLELGTRPAL
ncbi:GNAT family N-acetyltransferase [Catenulispora sp. GP43]|uniref:GNAT family N-acetyltransferase n=1 Tax=Catenulispora sp. GP43 TaxID=3156263 RepID=UPI003517DD03